MRNLVGPRDLPATDKIDICMIMCEAWPKGIIGILLWTSYFLPNTNLLFFTVGSSFDICQSSRTVKSSTDEKNSPHLKVVFKLYIQLYNLYKT